MTVRNWLGDWEVVRGNIRQRLQAVADVAAKSAGKTPNTHSAGSQSVRGTLRTITASVAHRILHVSQDLLGVPGRRSPWGLTLHRMGWVESVSACENIRTLSARVERHCGLSTSSHVSY